MKIGFTGTRYELEFYQRKKVVSVLEGLLDEITYAITGACLGIDAFVAHWFAEHTNVQQIIVIPPFRTLIDHTLYGIQRAVFIEMPNEGHTKATGVCYRARNQKIVDLSDRMVAFYKGDPKSGTKMTMNMAVKAGNLAAEDIHRI